MKLTDYLNKTTQAEFAEKLGVTQSMVSQWQKNTRPIAPAQCVAIERITKGEVTRQELRDDWQDIWPTDLPSQYDQRHLPDRRITRRKS